MSQSRVGPNGQSLNQDRPWTTSAIRATVAGPKGERMLGRRLNIVFRSRTSAFDSYDILHDRAWGRYLSLYEIAKQKSQVSISSIGHPFEGREGDKLVVYQPRLTWLSKFRQPIDHNLHCWPRFRLLMPAGLEYVPNGAVWRIFVRAHFRSFSESNLQYDHRILADFKKGESRSQGLDPK
jgi:hypothetical protein